MGLHSIMAESKVFCEPRSSIAVRTVGLLEALSVGVGGPETEVDFGAGIVWGSTWGPGSVLELQVLTVGMCGSLSSCCIMGAVADVGRMGSGPGEGSC